jgi:hypothetical protein
MLAAAEWSVGGDRQRVDSKTPMAPCRLDRYASTAPHVTVPSNLEASWARRRRRTTNYFGN